MGSTTEAVVAPDADALERPHRSVDRRLTTAERLLAGLMVATFAVMVVAASRSQWIPAGDEALLELKIRDLPDRVPLVGVYSRFGWNHPGPLQIWLLAVPYQLLRSSEAMLIGTLLGHLAALAAAWVLARRIDRVAGWTVLISLLGVMLAVPADIGRSPWNPYVALIAGGALVVSAWAVAERVPWGPIGLVAFGSLLVQAHVVTAPLVGLTSVVAVALACAPRSDGDVAVAPVVPRRSYALAALVGVALWAGPVADQLWSAEPNASMLQMSNSGERVGLVGGIGVLTQSFAAWPSWLNPDRLSSPVVDQSWTVPIWMLVPLLGLVVALKRSDGRFVRGSLVSIAALASLVLTSSMIGGGLHRYLIVEDGAVVAVSIAIGAASLLQPARHRWGAALLVLAVGGVASLAIGLCFRTLLASDPRPRETAAITETVDAIRSATEDSDEIVVSVPRSDLAQALTAGVVVQLERDGLEVRLRGAGPSKVGDHRLVDPDWGDSEWVLLAAPELGAARRDGWTVTESIAGPEQFWLARRGPDY